MVTMYITGNQACRCTIFKILTFMNIKIIPISIGLLLLCSMANAQQVVDNLCMQVIGSNGLSAEKLGKHYDATLGEVMIATLATSDGSFSVTQGFHQPECALASVGVDDLAATWSLELFPNPTSGQLHIQYQTPTGSLLNARLWSITGSLIQDWQTQPSGAVLDCTELAAGIYLLDLRDAQTGEKTIARFVKTSN